ncbi:MAG TPA: 3-phosphoshikimate 1-carboxyvinyltransferase, partial [Bryobacteraceae bacterium]|nr:3-phosphoshikimate 1-carboxyvinyltransferase [Bryobacteraceae bacterium]
MDQQISPVTRLKGEVSLPGDKSISHRYAMLTGIAEGTSVIENYATGADCQSTLGCMRSLGVAWTKDGSQVTVEGRGLRGLNGPATDLDAGNSGSTIRMLSGILAAQPFRTTIGGDESLSRRPMARIIKPLREMGAQLDGRDDTFPPLTITGSSLHAIDYTLPVPSAQVKSCVLLAGLFANGTTTVRESVRTRDHTEIALREFGAEITTRKGEISIVGGQTLQGRNLTVPGDLSSAAFFLVAGSIVPESQVVIRNVGLNPSRTALLDFLAAAGARVRVLDVQQPG